MPDDLTSMNISLTGGMRGFVRERMKEGGFANASEYLRHLIRQDAAATEQERIDRLLRVGLRSGPGVPLNRELVDDLKRRSRAASTGRATGRNGARTRKAG